MDANRTRQIGLAVGAVIGAILGAGAAYLLITSPAPRDSDEEPHPITAKDLLGLTSTAASLLRKLDDVRRRT